MHSICVLGFFASLAEQLDADARRACLSRRLDTVQDSKGEKFIAGRPSAFARQSNGAVDTVHLSRNGRKRFLRGLPPENGDLRGGNDIERQEAAD